MTREQAIEGTAVRIPTRKSVGHPLSVFQNRLLRDGYDGNYLLLFYNENRVYLRYPQVFATKQRIPAQIQIHEFAVEDLDKLEDITEAVATPVQPQLFRQNNDLFPKTIHEAPQNEYGLPHLVFGNDDEQPDEDIEPNKLKLREVENPQIPEAKIDGSFVPTNHPLTEESFPGCTEGRESFVYLTMGEPLPIVKDEPQVGLRYNEGKLDFTLMDMRAFEPMIQVLEYGAHKYSVFTDKNGQEYKGSEVSKEDATRMHLDIKSSGRDNWKLGGPNMTISKLFSSLFRHIASFLGGEDNDKESGLSHVGHIQCNVMFLGYHMLGHLRKKKQKQGTKFDDRFKG